MEGWIELITKVFSGCFWEDNTLRLKAVKMVTFRLCARVSRYGKNQPTDWFWYKFYTEFYDRQLAAPDRDRCGKLYVSSYISERRGFEKQLCHIESSIPLPLKYKMLLTLLSHFYRSHSYHTYQAYGSEATSGIGSEYVSPVCFVEFTAGTQDWWKDIHISW